MEAKYLSTTLLSIWYQWHKAGINIGADRAYHLEQAGFLEVTESEKYKLYTEHDNILLKRRTFGTLSDKEVQLNNMVLLQEISSDFNDLTEDSILTSEEYLFRTKAKDFRVSEYPNVITRQMWDLEEGEKFNYSREFYEWINSINDGWQFKRNYHKFNLYKEQARRWLSEKEMSFNPNHNEDQMFHYLRIERKRCLENSLYAMNKFLFLKEGEMEGGKIKYEAWDSQALGLYLFDLRLSLLFGKLRQVGYTTTINGASIMRTMLSPSYHTKFITEKATKGHEIHEDKVAFALSNYPDYLVPTVLSDVATGTFKFGNKDYGKGRQGGANSKFVVEPPYETVVNGGSPNLVLIDEGGNIPIIGDIINQAMPALVWVNPKTQRMEWKRQLITWGTGGNMEKGGAGYEALVNQAMEAWKDKDYQYGLIFVFLNAYAKPGVNDDFLKIQKKIAYSKPGTEGVKARRTFHQSYPITVSDMFITSLATLLDQTDIEVRKKAARDIQSEWEHGYFEPEYDTSKPMPEGNVVPFKVVGARFIHLSEQDIIDDPDKVMVSIRCKPEKWKHRYFHGTDPIFTSSGKSKMASAIWDSITKRVVAEVNFRTNDYRVAYLQNLCLNLYYGKPDWLIEMNVGSGFRDFLEQHECTSNLVSNKLLPDVLQNQGLIDGVKKFSGNTAKYIVNKTEELLLMYKDNLDSLQFWQQVGTYTKKTTAKGNETYEPLNPKIHFDDLLDAYTYAYICFLAMSYKTPKQEENSDSERDFKISNQYVRDDNMNLVLRKVKIYKDGRRVVISGRQRGYKTSSGNRV